MVRRPAQRAVSNHPDEQFFGVVRDAARKRARLLTMRV
jgi:hypothetical protein